MKAPDFWYRPEGREVRWLAPFENLYRAGADVRRFFAMPYRAGVPVICVGNVVAGGSGKTPTALALAALLQKNGQRPVFVTRGYGGAQSGPLRVDAAHHHAEDVGDEALLLLRQAPVWIGRNRAKAIREAEKEASHVILDDGLQNPHIAPDLSLLVMDGSAGLGNGHLIPAGPLREPLAEALQRVTAVILIGENGDIPSPLRGGLGRGEVIREQDFNIWNKSPSFTPPPLTPPARGGGSVQSKPILHATLLPSIPADFPRDAKFLAFAGIGRPEKFFALCRKEGLTLAATQDFADHHIFTRNELQALERKARFLGARLLTTEKDFVRLPNDFRARVVTFPIRLEFGDVGAMEKLLYSTTAPSFPS
jgi:tetraacyldisaccharide 4'-kinase